jgi:beta-mannosidase
MFPPCRHTRTHTCNIVTVHNVCFFHTRPEPFKYITFPAVQDLGLEISLGADGESVHLSTKKPVKGIVLDVVGGGEEVQWGDQAVDLVPGDAQVVSAVGLKGREVKARFLGDGTA